MTPSAALCKPHSASKQKLSVPVHSTLLDDFAVAPRNVETMGSITDHL